MGKAGKILVLCGEKTTNFPPELVSEPRIVFWTNKEADEKYNIPIGVVLVVSSSFTSHATWNRVVAMAKKQGIAYEVIQKGTGEIRNLLQHFKTQKMKEEKAYITPSELLARQAMGSTIVGVVTSPLNTAQGGEMETTRDKPVSATGFIREEANFVTEDYSTEIRRLKDLATSKGLVWTSSFTRIFYNLRAKKCGLLRHIVRRSTTPKPTSEENSIESTPHKSRKDSECIEFLKKHAAMYGVAVLEIIQYAEGLLRENKTLNEQVTMLEKELKRLRKVDAWIKKAPKS